MKRKAVWLALPLILCALMFGVKWRAEHPTPTKEDLEIRALMSQPSIVDIRYDSGSTFLEDNPFGVKVPLGVKFSQRDFLPFINSLYLAPYDSKTRGTIPNREMFTFSLYSHPPKKGRRHVVLFVYDGFIGTAHISPPISKNKLRYTLHPVTIKRWMKLLLANPRIGPQLKARMKS